MINKVIALAIAGMLVTSGASNISSIVNVNSEESYIEMTKSIVLSEELDIRVKVTEEEKKELIKDKKELDIVGENALDYTVYYASPEYSSTVDRVVVVDMKVKLEDGSNVIYMVEYHINENNELYGHNIWAY